MLMFRAFNAAGLRRRATRRGEKDEEKRGRQPHLAGALAQLAVDWRHLADGQPRTRHLLRVISPMPSDTVANTCVVAQG
jgi:hypothetical protein